MKLPEDFLAQMRALLGADAEAFLQAASQDDASVSLRQNRRKCSLLPFENAQPVPWCPGGFYLDKRPTFTLDPLFHAGAYYVQEASSMFLYQVVQEALRILPPHDGPLRVLDLCAAPGGKSTLLIDALPDDAVLVANEVVHTRANILAENLSKWGYPHVLVTEAKPEDLPGTYDLILTDVPCSGEGMFRKDSQAVEQWNVANVRMCAARQREIVQSIWPRLRPGGCLVYSTCTFNTAENEENVTWIADTLGAEVLAVDTRASLGRSLDELGITASLLPDAPALPVARFMFHRSRGEGLFMALLQKNSSNLAGVAGASFAGASRKDKNRRLAPVKTGRERLWPMDCLRDAETFQTVEVQPGRYHAMSASVKDLYDVFAKARVRMHLAGITLGELKGRDLVPDAVLALSQQLDRQQLVCTEVDTKTALDYLRRSAVTLNTNLPRGYVLLCYHGLPLGWAKHLGNRANNLYPNDWRIRTL